MPRCPRLPAPPVFDSTRRITLYSLGNRIRRPGFTLATGITTQDIIRLSAGPFPHGLSRYPDAGTAIRIGTNDGGTCSAGAGCATWYPPAECLPGSPVRL